MSTRRSIRYPPGADIANRSCFNLNQKDGTFCDASEEGGPRLEGRRGARGIAIGDLFNDGNMDIVIGDIDGAPMLRAIEVYCRSSLGQF